jgi:iron complex transport system ATP-binding protein
MTHNIHEIPPELSRVVVLKEGRIVTDGPKKEIFSSKTRSVLFNTAVELMQINGFYQDLPGTAP